MKKHNIDKSKLHDLVAYQRWAELKDVLDEAEEAVGRGEVVIPTEYPTNAEPQEYAPLRTLDEFKHFRSGWEKRNTDEEQLND